MATIGVLLAGGQGIRLRAGVPKALAKLGGRTLLARALHTLLQVSSEVIVVAPANLELPLPKAGELRITPLADPPGDGGPVPALVAALAHRPFQWAFVLGVDFPFVTPEVLRSLQFELDRQRVGAELAKLSERAEDDLDEFPWVCLPMIEAQPQPLVSVVHQAALERFLALADAGERSLTAIFARCRPHYPTESALQQLGVQPDNFLNVNSPSDLALAEAKLSSWPRRRSESKGEGIQTTVELTSRDRFMRALVDDAKFEAAKTPSLSREASGALALGGRSLIDVHAELKAVDEATRAFWAYDLSGLRRRAARMRAAFAGLAPLTAYAMKANSWPPILNVLASKGFGAEAGSLGELKLAMSCGFPAERRVLNGNGRTPEEADWVARHGVLCVNADSIEELDLLQEAATRHSRTLRVALRVNPQVEIEGHPHVATGHGLSKFGVDPADALEAWRLLGRWPRLDLDGVHVHIGSQIQSTRPLERALQFVIDLREQASAFGHLLKLVNLGGGFGINYETGEDDGLVESYAQLVKERLGDALVQIVLEPGRWLVAPIGVLVAEVLNVKHRQGQRFVVLAAGMNDLIRPALYGARHRIVAVTPRSGEVTKACVVGPVCESGDQFDAAAELPPLERGDLVAILDAGAYGASMSSTYNGRPRLREVGIE